MCWHLFVLAKTQVGITTNPLLTDQLVYVQPPRGTCPTWYCWKLKRALNGTRAASRAWGGLVKNILVRDGATSMEAVPLTFMHNDGYVVTKHSDDFIVAGYQQGLDSLNHNLDNKLGTTAGNNRNNKFLRRTVELADGAFWWNPDPRHVWLDARRPRRLVRKTVKNLAEAEGSITVWTTQRFSSRWPVDAGAMGRLVRVMRYCTDRLTLPWRFKFDNPQPKLAVHVDTDHS